MFKSFVPLALGLASGANAFWRMECPGRLDVARLDPIVDPGKLSTHAHSIHGSSGFSENVDSAGLQGGDCTSCRVSQDKSSYWTPAMYFEDRDTGKFELVNQVGGMLAYYLLYGDDITAFPDNFMMISGDTSRRSYTAGDPSQPDPDKSMWASMGQTKQSILEQRAIGFNCLNYDKAPEGTLYRHYLPDKAYLDKNCKDGVRIELMFPSCWNGKDTDSANHKDHVAFPDLVMTGTCPEGFETRLPSLMFEVIWDTNAYKNRNGRFVMANGDPTGFGYHGDFMMGWDRDFLQQAVNTCTNPSGRIEDCPLFDVISQQEATSCKLDKATPKILQLENVLGPALQLPGNVKITLGGGEESQPEDPAPTQAEKPTLAYTPGELPTDSARPLPGQVFKETSKGGDASSPAPTSESAPSAPIAAAAAAADTTEAPTPQAPEPSFYSTQYITNGNIVTKVFWEEQLVYVTETVDATATVTAPANRKRHAHLRGHARRSV